MHMLIEKKSQCDDEVSYLELDFQIPVFIVGKRKCQENNWIWSRTGQVQCDTLNPTLFVMVDIVMI